MHFDESILFRGPPCLKVPYILCADMSGAAGASVARAPEVLNGANPNTGPAAPSQELGLEGLEPAAQVPAAYMTRRTLSATEAETEVQWLQAGIEQAVFAQKVREHRSADQVDRSEEAFDGKALASRVRSMKNLQTLNPEAARNSCLWTLRLKSEPMLDYSVAPPRLPQSSASRDTGGDGTLHTSCQTPRSSPAFTTVFSRLELRVGMTSSFKQAATLATMSHVKPRTESSLVYSTGDHGEARGMLEMVAEMQELSTQRRHGEDFWVSISTRLFRTLHVYC